MNKRTALIILDGWGIGLCNRNNAIFTAKTPFIDSLHEKYPNTTLLTCGEYVGLPDGQMGNSEVGHLNLGAGRIVYQELGRINNSIADKSFHRNKTLIDTIQYAKESNKNLHLMGLLSDGGVHSHINHLLALCDICESYGLQHVFIHAFTDGRDCDPKSGLGFMRELQNHIKNTSAKIASVCGRYYAMDRDKRWERVKEAHDLLVTGRGKEFSNPIEAIEASYEEGVTDEFIKPCKIINTASVTAGDAVICFNFRTDRCREITQTLTQQDFPEHNMCKIPLHYVTMTNYDDTFLDVQVIFNKEDVTMPLGEVLANAGKKQIRIAETEKYPHVTFFFNGGREQAFIGEERQMIPSPKVATYDLMPEMSAFQVCDAAVTIFNMQEIDFMCLNFANPDMVGHTGVFESIVKACETIDSCVETLVKSALDNNYTVLLTADHGNAEFAVNDDGMPNTAHTLNPVPFFLIDRDFKPALHHGILADVAPTILKLMGVPKPSEMTGKELF